MRHHRSVRLLVATATTAVLALSSVPADAATSPKASGDRAAARLAAAWQASQLTKGRIHNGQFNFDDWGLTIDTVFALAATGNEPRALSAAGRAVEHHYFGGYATSSGDIFAGSMAKSLVAAEVLGRNPRNFGGHNVRKLVLGTVAPASAGFEAGRVRDTGSTDYSNTFAQAYAVIGLARSGGVPQRVVDYLVKQQCSRGWFRLDEVPGAGCAGSDTPDVDATAVAVEALSAARKAGATVPAGTLASSGRWLLSVQGKNGSFGGGQLTAGANSNSTGLAAIALRLTGHDHARHRAATWVRRLQITRNRATKPVVRKDIGAIAYNRAGLHDGLSDGIQKIERDQFRRATAQALFAFRPASLATLTA